MADSNSLTVSELGKMVQAQRRHLAKMSNPGQWQTRLAGGNVFAMMEVVHQPQEKLE